MLINSSREVPRELLVRWGGKSCWFAGRERMERMREREGRNSENIYYGVHTRNHVFFLKETRNHALGGWFLKKISC